MRAFEYFSILVTGFGDINLNLTPTSNTIHFCHTPCKFDVAKIYKKSEITKFFSIFFHFLILEALPRIELESNTYEIFVLPLNYRAII